jgi:hypothetical protein
MDGQDLFLDIDSAYGVARAAAAGVDGIAVGIQTLIKRLHESGRLKSIDEGREKLKIRRVIDVLGLDLGRILGTLRDSVEQNWRAAHWERLEPALGFEPEFADRLSWCEAKS